MLIRMLPWYLIFQFSTVLQDTMKLLYTCEYTHHRNHVVVKVITCHYKVTASPNQYATMVTAHIINTLLL